MDSFNFEKLDMPKPQLKILCDGTILLYMKCTNEVKINKSQKCFNDFNNVFNCLKVLKNKHQK